MKNNYLLATLLSFAFTAKAAKLGEFSHHQAKTKDNSIAVIDLSDFSLRWLAKNKDFLIEKKLPLLVLQASHAEAVSLIDKYPGLIAGAAPPPKELMKQYFEQVGITRYPAVAEGNIIWQVRPKDILLIPTNEAASKEMQK